MASKYNGIVHLGEIDDLITLAAGETATWAHAQGVKATVVETRSATGALLTSFTIAQPDVNTITVNNGTAGPLAMWVRVIFEEGTIGQAGAIAAAAVPVA